MPHANRATRNEYMREYVAARYTVLKKRAIEYKGGKCQGEDCGYDKCLAALEFHHRDPSTKELDWGKLKRRSWEFIIKELDKCDLLCANCHREEHYNPAILERAQTYLRSRKGAKSQYAGQLDRNCEQCEDVFKGPEDQRFCSSQCSHRNKERITWPIDLPELVTQTSKRLVAARLGVSDKAVAKRLLQHHSKQT